MLIVPGWDQVDDTGVVHPRRALEAAEDWWARAVQVLHMSEVLGRLRLVGQHHREEGILVRRLERPIEQALVANSRLRDCAHSLSARRAGSVRRPDLEVIRLGLEFLEASEERSGGALGGPDNVGDLLQEVGPPHIADEHEVSREHAHGPRRPGRVRYHKTDVLRRVSRGMEHIEPDVADHEAIAVTDEGRAGLSGECVLPLVAALFGEVQPRAEAFGQLP
jgi:hypothetical protein